MRRSEKLGMLTGLIVGTILLLISFLMGVKPVCKVWGSQTAYTASEAEKKGVENSFRYKDGKLIKFEKYINANKVMDFAYEYDEMGNLIKIYKNNIEA